MIYGPDLSQLKNTEDLPTAEIEVASVREADSPRRHGEKPGHIRALAESGDKLPPIVVHRPTMRVIDGMHRLLAAKLRGEEAIQARLFDGDESSAFILAVRENVMHGLPLSLSDRKAAAVRIITYYPDWSDRMVASVTGLAAKTVAAVRGRPSAEDQQLDRRGRDGRVRPLSAAEGRQAAAAYIRANPGASLRQVALNAGISHETARDVRGRVDRGLDPVKPPRKNLLTRTNERIGRKVLRGEKPSLDAGQAFSSLSTDPAFRGSEMRRSLLRVMAACRGIEKHSDRLANTIPPHCLARVAEIANECARVWSDFALSIEKRESQTPL